ncbi:MAG: site-2 protease family protein [Isosphaeraceae bacterium]
MLGTSTTPYDLRFRFLDIPVRIHPLFWLMAAVLGFQENNIPAVLIWIGCVLVSILVHEYGHGLMAKHFHGSPSIVLYGLGGLCSSQEERTPGQRLAVLFAGPGAGFILCAVVLAVTSLALGITGGEHLAVMQHQFGLSADKELFLGAIEKFPSLPVFMIYFNMIWINLLWGLVNLLPIYPLDGGQATQVVLSQVDRTHGVRRAHIVSLVTAGVLAVLAASASRHDYFLVIFFGVLAVLNYQVLQSLHQAKAFGVYHDDDWWRG